MKKVRLKLKWKIIFGIILFVLILLLFMRFISTSGIKVKEYKVTDKKTGELRTAKYSDIVILLRSLSGCLQR